MFTDTDIKEARASFIHVLVVFLFICLSLGLGLTVAFSCGGCGALAQPDRSIMPVPTAPTWVDEAIEDGARFWYLHGIGFAIDYPGGVQVKVMKLPPDRVAEYDINDNASIHLDPALEHSPNKGCIVAHELGHCLGMDHVETGPGKSLMAEVVTTDVNGQCFWSELDQDELIRVAQSGRGIQCP